MIPINITVTFVTKALSYKLGYNAKTVVQNINSWNLGRSTDMVHIIYPNADGTSKKPLW